MSDFTTFRHDSTATGNGFVTATCDLETGPEPNEISVAALADLPIGPRVLVAVTTGCGTRAGFLLDGKGVLDLLHLALGAAASLDLIPKVGKLTLGGAEPPTITPEAQPATCHVEAFPVATGLFGGTAPGEIGIGLDDVPDMGLRAVVSITAASGENAAALLDAADLQKAIGLLMGTGLSGGLLDPDGFYPVHGAPANGTRQ